jgi:hypothetical protein
MAEKQFKIPAAAMKPLAEGHGGCFATDMITVEGQRVGYMYREAPDFADDSGWRFFSGKEPPDYLDDPAHTEIYDVNTIANYDPAIIPLLDSPTGSAFERRGLFKRFVAIPFEPPDDE